MRLLAIIIAVLLLVPCPSSAAGEVYETGNPELFYYGNTQWKERAAAPASWASGYGRLWFSSADNRLYYTTDAGVTYGPVADTSALYWQRSGGALSPITGSDIVSAISTVGSPGIGLYWGYDTSGSSTDASIGIYGEVFSTSNDAYGVFASGNLGVVGWIDIGERAAPAAATSGAGRVYFKSSDSRLYYKTDGGTEYGPLDAGGSYTSWTLAGDAGSSQTINDGNTATIAGGSDGIDTSAGATDTVTINFDPAEVQLTDSLFVHAPAFATTLTNVAGAGPACSFSDTGVSEFTKYFTIQMPDNYDGGTIVVEATAFSTFAGTTGNAYFSIAAAQLADGSNISTIAFGTTINVTSAMNASGGVPLSEERFAFAALTASGSPAGGTTLVFKFGRDSSNAADTFTTGKVDVTSLRLEYGTNSLAQ